jgi:hypothetical protein
MKKPTLVSPPPPFFKADHYPHLFPELLTRADAGTEAGDEHAQCL